MVREGRWTNSLVSRVSHSLRKQVASMCMREKGLCSLKFEARATVYRRARMIVMV